MNPGYKAGYPVVFNSFSEVICIVDETVYSTAAEHWTSSSSGANRNHLCKQNRVVLNQLPNTDTTPARFQSESCSYVISVAPIFTTHHDLGPIIVADTRQLTSNLLWISTAIPMGKCLGDPWTLSLVDKKSLLSNWITWTQIQRILLTY